MIIKNVKYVQENNNSPPKGEVMVKLMSVQQREIRFISFQKKKKKKVKDV